MIEKLLHNIHLTPHEKSIVEYIKQHPKCILHHNAKELSELMYVSSPTIIRFVKKLGFKGYIDFQLTYSQEYTLHQQNQSHFLTAESSINEILETLPSIYQDVFSETQKLTHKEAFVRTINYMLHAKQIDFYANDNNYSEVQSVCLKLNAIGIRAQAFNALNSTYIETIHSQDVLSFVVSHSGQNTTMVDIAYFLRKKRMRVIAITGKTNSTLSLICNESLYIDSSSHQMPHIMTLYGLSIHYVLDVLMTSLIFKKLK